MGTDRDDDRAARRDELRRRAQHLRERVGLARQRAQEAFKEAHALIELERVEDLRRLLVQRAADALHEAKAHTAEIRVIEDYLRRKRAS